MRITRTAAVAATLVPAALVAAMLAAPSAQADPATSFELVGRYAVPGGAEVSAVSGDRLYVLDGAGIDIVSISDPSAPQKLTRVDLSAYGAATTSVAARGDWVAVALVADPKTSPGTVVLLNRAGKVRGVAQVGANPDMVTFDATASRLLVANEGEPSGYTSPSLATDPVGSVSVIDVARLNASRPGAVRTIGFQDFNAGGSRASELSADVRVFGPGASVAQDLEPEYIAVEGDTAWVTLQENNAIARIDLAEGRLVSIAPLALKDHSLPGNGLDPSDRENGTGNPGSIAIANWPVMGMPMPDGIASYTAGGRTFLITANEGDARDWPGYAEEIRVGSASYLLDSTVFPNAATLKGNARLGRLNVTGAAGRAGGDLDNDGDRDRIQVFGTRSASIWTADGQLVWDSGDLFEQKTAMLNPSWFNSTNDANEFDTRSDNKGPEPEGVAIGAVDGRTYAFVVLERTGGFIVLDVTDPESPTFVQYANSRDFAIDPRTTATDSGPEVVSFVPASQSPSGKALVVVSNEISGTVSIWSPTA